MQLRHRMEYLRREHEELLNLANRIEKLLESASSSDFEEHLKSLPALRSLEHGLAGIVEHCRREERIIESTYHHSLQLEELARMDAEHEQIVRLVRNFREELKYATADRTMAMILPGMELVKWLRAHIAYEREMLGRIAGLRKSRVRSSEKKKTGKESRSKARRPIAKRKARTKAIHLLPYTLEPHPEL